jgi:hypothetical protein
VSWCLGGKKVLVNPLCLGAFVAKKCFLRRGPFQHIN